MQNNKDLNYHIERARKQEKDSQRWIYETYVGFVFNLTRKYLADDDSAADATQETMITVMDKIKNYDEKKGAFKSWIAKIAINNALRWGKIFKGNQRLENLIELAGSIAQHEGIIEEIDYLVKGLPEKHRVIYKLYFDMDLDHSEIAELLEISQQNSRVRVYRLVSELREKLKL